MNPPMEREAIAKYNASLLTRESVPASMSERIAWHLRLLEVQIAQEVRELRIDLKRASQDTIRFRRSPENQFAIFDLIWDMYRCLTICRLYVLIRFISHRDEALFPKKDPSASATLAHCPKVFELAQVATVRYLALCRGEEGSANKFFNMMATHPLTKDGGEVHDAIMAGISTSRPFIMRLEDARHEDSKSARQHLRENPMIFDDKAITGLHLRATQLATDLCPFSASTLEQLVLDGNSKEITEIITAVHSMNTVRGHCQRKGQPCRHKCIQATPSMIKGWIDYLWANLPEMPDIEYPAKPSIGHLLGQFLIWATVDYTYSSASSNESGEPQVVLHFEPIELGVSAEFICELSNAVFEWEASCDPDPNAAQMMRKDTFVCGSTRMYFRKLIRMAPDAMTASTNVPRAVGCARLMSRLLTSKIALAIGAGSRDTILDMIRDTKGHGDHYNWCIVKIDS